MQLFSGVGEIVNTKVQTRDGSGLSYWAHVGGVVAGVLLVCLFRNRDVNQRA